MTMLVVVVRAASMGYAVQVSADVVCSRSMVLSSSSLPLPKTAVGVVVVEVDVAAMTAPKVVAAASLDVADGGSF